MKWTKTLEKEAMIGLYFKMTNVSADCFFDDVTI